MDEIRYVDTRGAVTNPVAFTEAVVDGLAPGGGLFDALMDQYRQQHQYLRHIP